jgi:hypothetical protein
MEIHTCAVIDNSRNCIDNACSLTVAFHFLMTVVPLACLASAYHRFTFYTF